MIQICICHARMEEANNPGTYEYELNRMLKENNLPTIKVPKDDAGTTSTTTITTTTTTASASRSDFAPTAMDTVSAVPATTSTRAKQQPPQETPKPQRPEASWVSVYRPASQATVPLQQIPLAPSSDFGLNFYTSKKEAGHKNIFLQNT